MSDEDHLRHVRSLWAEDGPLVTSLPQEILRVRAQKVLAQCLVVLSEPGPLARRARGALIEYLIQEQDDEDGDPDFEPEPTEEDADFEPEFV